jgi:NhaP-type Na+/H+ or K+/H+ antiporter
MAPDDRGYLLRLVETRTGLPQAEAESRVNQVIAQASAAIARAKHGAVILAVMAGGASIATARFRTLFRLVWKSTQSFFSIDGGSSSAPP